MQCILIKLLMYEGIQLTGEDCTLIQTEASLMKWPGYVDHRWSKTVATYCACILYFCNIYTVYINKVYLVHLSLKMCPLWDVEGGILAPCCSKLLPHSLLTRSCHCSVTEILLFGKCLIISHCSNLWQTSSIYNGGHNVWNYAQQRRVLCNRLKASHSLWLLSVRVFHLTASLRTNVFTGIK